MRPRHFVRFDRHSASMHSVPCLCFGSVPYSPCSTCGQVEREAWGRFPFSWTLPRAFPSRGPALQPHGRDLLLKGLPDLQGATAAHGFPDQLSACLAALLLRVLSRLVVQGFRRGAAPVPVRVGVTCCQDRIVILLLQAQLRQSAVDFCFGEVCCPHPLVRCLLQFYACRHFSRHRGLAPCARGILRLCRWLVERRLGAWRWRVPQREAAFACGRHVLRLGRRLVELRRAVWRRCVP